MGGGVAHLLNPALSDDRGFGLLRGAAAHDHHGRLWFDTMETHSGKLVFAQLTSHLPLSTFRRCVSSYGGEHKVKSFSCLEQFLCLAFAQLTYRESLRDTWRYAVGFRAALWRMRTRCATGVSMPRSRSA